MLVLQLWPTDKIQALKMAHGKARPRGSARRSGKQDTAAPLYAAVDLGTNNCRLLIAQPAEPRFRVVDSHSQIARLGEGLADSGVLSEAAISRAMDALVNIRDKLKARRVAHVRCIATEACRRAGNGGQFVERVRNELGLSFRIISPAEEARLAMIGCRDLVDPEAGSVLVLDIGGGSTEISLVDADTMRAAADITALTRSDAIRDWTSLPLGVVTLSESFAHLPEAAAYSAMRDHAHTVISGWKAVRRVNATLSAAGGHLIGTSGTVTCLAGVHLGLPRYRRDRVDGSWMHREAAMDAIALLRDAGPEGRGRLPTIGPERAGLMLSGCAILEAAWQVFPAERMRVADRGLREGLLLSMMYGPPRARRRRRKATRPKPPETTEGTDSHDR